MSSEFKGRRKRERIKTSPFFMENSYAKDFNYVTIECIIVYK